MKLSMDMIEQPFRKPNLPDLRVGNQVRLILKIVEGDSERLQAFEGTIIRLRGHGLSETVTVRKISYGVGVERTFPIHSPRIEKIEILRVGQARRARLYYLRKRTGKAARLEEKVDHLDTSPDSKKAPAPAASPASPAAIRT